MQPQFWFFFFFFTQNCLSISLYLSRFANWLIKQISDLSACKTLKKSLDLNLTFGDTQQYYREQHLQAKRCLFCFTHHVWLSLLMIDRYAILLQLHMVDNGIFFTLSSQMRRIRSNLTRKIKWFVVRTTVQFQCPFFPQTNWQNLPTQDIVIFPSFCEQVFLFVFLLFDWQSNCQSWQQHPSAP